MLHEFAKFAPLRLILLPFPEEGGFQTPPERQDGSQGGAEGPPWGREPRLDATLEEYKRFTPVLGRFTLMKCLQTHRQTHGRDAEN